MSYCKIQTLQYADFIDVIHKYPQFYVMVLLSRTNTASCETACWWTG